MLLDCTAAVANINVEQTWQSHGCSKTTVVISQDDLQKNIFEALMLLNSFRNAETETVKKVPDFDKILNQEIFLTP